MSESPPCKDSILLDLLRECFDLKNDSQLAGFLCITRTTVHHARHGKRRLGIVQRLKILDHIGFLEARQLVESIAPKSLADTIRKNSNILAHKRIKHDKSNDA